MEVSTSELLMYLGKLYLEKELVLIQVAELQAVVGNLENAVDGYEAREAWVEADES